MAEQTDEEVAKVVAELEKKLADSEAALADANKAIEESKAAADVTKSDVEKAFDEQREINKSLVEEIGKLRTEAADRDAVSKAKTFDKLPIEVDKFGPVLREVGEKLSPEAAGEIERVLRAANESFGKAFKEAGTGGEGNEGGDAYSRLEGMAKAYATEHSVPIAKAMTAVLDTDEGRALYNESRDSDFVKPVGARG